MSKHSTNGFERKISASSKTSVSASAGAVDEDVFRASFVPSLSVTVYSSKELNETISRIKDSLSVDAEEWEKRVNALKLLRALVANGASQFEDFIPLLKTLETLVDGCLRDLRSSVVREACITVAYLSQELRNRFDRFAETIMQTLISLMSNSAKIMASSGIVAMRFILENTCSARLLPILASTMSSKSNITRKCICEFMEIVFRIWPVNVLEKHSALLQDTMKRGIYDPDQEARNLSRRAFPLFAAKFPDQANSLLQNLDPQKRKLIEKDLGGTGLAVSSGVAVTRDHESSRSRSNSQTSLLSQSSVNPVTRRPTKPVLGTTAIGVNSSRARPPITNMNDFNTVGRYARIGSVSSTVDGRGRQSNRKTVSQSQPTSREVSPSRFAQLSFGPLDGHQPTPYNTATYAARNGSTGGGTAFKTSGFTHQSSIVNRIPRSQGASRETSPARSVTGGYFGPSGLTNSDQQRLPARSPNYMSMRAHTRPSLSSMSDCGGDSSRLPMQLNSRHTFESDDNFSETSSQCSDRSSRSAFATSRQHSVHATDNLKEILLQLSGAQWSERKDGLINLQQYMRSGNPLSNDDIHRLTELFGKMFADSQSKVVSLFMDTLQFFIKEYNPYLRDWLYILLIRLLSRQGAEVLGSHQKAIQETLFVLRSHFPLNLQFSTCCRFIMDNTQTPNMKVKVCLLEYLKDLILMMSPDVISAPTTEMVSAIARIITWSAEPKSADVRRMASRVIIKLYDLNAHSFSVIQQNQPRAIQERASEILKTYQKTTTGGSAGSGIGPIASTTIDGSGQNSPAWKPSSVEQNSHILGDQSSPAPSDPGRLSPETMNKMIRQTTEGLQSLTTAIQPTAPGFYRRTSTGPVLSQGDPYSLSAMTKSPNVAGSCGGVLRTMQSSDFIQPIPLQALSSIPPPSGGTLIFDQGDGPKLRKPVIGYQTLKKIREMPPENIVRDMLEELSHYNERHDQRKACMVKFIKFFRDGTISDWDEYFKPILLTLLETLGDDGGEIRALALKVLQELVRTKPDFFHDFACLFVIKVLEACRDDDKTVTRAAEDCAKATAQSLPPDMCFKVLPPLINDWGLQINLPAVKMQEHVVRNSPPELVTHVLDTIVPGLVVGCNHEDSAMRKASIFCLVAIALKIGDTIWDQLGELHISKRRLLKLYIDRELNSGAVSTESLGTRS